MEKYSWMGIFVLKFYWNVFLRSNNSALVEMMAQFTDANFHHLVSLRQYTFPDSTVHEAYMGPLFAPSILQSGLLLESPVNNSKAYLIVDINMGMRCLFLICKLWDTVSRSRATVMVNSLVIWKSIFKMLCWNPYLWLMITNYIWTWFEVYHE